jgi:hypothetical protein
MDSILIRDEKKKNQKTHASNLKRLYYENVICI